MPIVLSMVLFLLSTFAYAQTLPGDPVSGRNLAHRICSDCHLVTEGQAKPAIDSAPPFAAIARQPWTTALSLRVFLQSPHSNMPDLILDPRETDDLISYILSRRP